ncbi:hypothetical protein VI817_007257 [Penicillium citrinum]|nr:hypothetical protein VI817_007257 [Penicillium citrinum]
MPKSLRLKKWKKSPILNPSRGILDITQYPELHCLQNNCDATQPNPFCAIAQLSSERRIRQDHQISPWS